MRNSRLIVLLKDFNDMRLIHSMGCRNQLVHYYVILLDFFKRKSPLYACTSNLYAQRIQEKTSHECSCFVRIFHNVRFKLDREALTLIRKEPYRTNDTWYLSSC